MSADAPSVLVVEDEPAQREVLAYNLEAEGFHVTRAETGDEALQLFDEVAPDLVVLDWMLPGVSGIEICRRLKSNPETRSVPVIMLSARSEEVDRVRGLETGADDYVVKPYSIVELMARVRTQLRRTRPATVGEVLEFEDIVLDAETHRVTRAGKPVKLGHLCRHAHRGRPYRPPEESTFGGGQGGSPAHGAWRGLCAWLKNSRSGRELDNSFDVDVERISNGST